MKYSLTRVSGNAKTGPMPVSTSHKGTCPDACPLKAKGCYAAYGPSAIHWNKLTNGERGVDWEQFISEVRAIPKGSLWRHNQAGDLPGSGDLIDREALGQLVSANRNKRGFTYTHYPVLDDSDGHHVDNQCSILIANENGFTINLSGNNVAHADQLADLGIAPVVAILPMDAENVSFTPAGRKVVACPAEKSDKVSCYTCGLCQDSKRSYIIGFRAHGTAKKHVDNIIARG